MTRTTCRRLFVPVLVVGLCLAPFAGVGNGKLLYLPSPIPLDPDEGGTALHWAVRLGAMDVVEALVAAGVDPDARDADGETALHWLARRNEGGPWLAGADRAAVLDRIDAAAAVAARARTCRPPPGLAGRRCTRPRAPMRPGWCRRSSTRESRWARRR